jgi:fatty acid desaturase
MLVTAPTTDTLRPVRHSTRQPVPDSTTRAEQGKGFVLHDPELERRIKALMRPHTGASLLAFGADWSSILLASIASAAAFAWWGVSPQSVMLYVLAVSIIGARMRGLENLIHDGLHRNLSPHQRMNDLLAWAFAAIPLLHHVGMERLAHFRHHGYFWKEGKDPDLARYLAMGVDRLPAASRLAAARILLAGFGPYVVDALPAFFIPRGESGRLRAVRLSVWIGALAVAALGGWLPGLLLYWFVPFTTSLMVIRYFGEVSEHVALGCSTEFATTRNNLSWWDQHVLHPHGDGYHLVHHLFPKVPHHNLARAHSLLMGDPTYARAGNHCHGVFVAARGGRSTLGDFSVKALEM